MWVLPALLALAQREFARRQRAMGPQFIDTVLGNALLQRRSPEQPLLEMGEGAGPTEDRDEDGVREARAVNPDDPAVRGEEEPSQEDERKEVAYIPSRYLPLSASAGTFPVSNT